MPDIHGFTAKDIKRIFCNHLTDSEYVEASKLGIRIPCTDKDSNVCETIIANTSKLLQVVANQMNSLFCSVLVNVDTNGINETIENIQSIVNDISSFTSEASLISGTVDDIGNSISGTVDDIGNSISGTVDDIGNSISETVDDIGNSISETVDDIGNSISETVDDFLSDE
jgi:phage-related protein